MAAVDHGGPEIGSRIAHAVPVRMQAEKRVLDDFVGNVGVTRQHVRQSRHRSLVRTKQVADRVDRSVATLIRRSHHHTLTTPDAHELFRAVAEVLAYVFRLRNPHRQPVKSS